MGGRVEVSTHPGGTSQKKKLRYVGRRVTHPRNNTSHQITPSTFSVTCPAPRPCRESRTKGKHHTGRECGRHSGRAAESETESKRGGHRELPTGNCPFRACVSANTRQQTESAGGMKPNRGGRAIALLSVAGLGGLCSGSLAPLAAGGGRVVGRESASKDGSHNNRQPQDR